MQSPLQNTKISKDYQLSFSKIKEKVLPLYDKFVPEKIKNRRNIEQQIQPDVIKIIRVNYVQSLHKDSPFSVLDSMPISLCASVRKNRAKLFKGIANVGYNAMKDIHFYGLKLSLLIDHEGYPTGYSVTSASVHDIHMAIEVVEQSPTLQVLADKGYVSQPLKDSFAKKKINFWTPRKSNSRQPKVAEDKLLGKLRKRIETVFSALVNLSDIGFLNRSLAGFESKLEAILLTYSFMLEEAQKVILGTLKYSLGNF